MFAKGMGTRGIRDAGTVSTRAVYLAIGVAEDGRREVLGLWLGEHEGAKFWLAVLAELRHRGLHDILIAVVDGLKGFPEALATAYPMTTVQTCIVHLLRYSPSCASYRERGILAKALKPIHQGGRCRTGAGGLRGQRSGSTLPGCGSELAGPVDSCDTPSVVLGADPQGDLHDQLD